MELALAPMEGVLDALLRKTLTALSLYDFAVTEFIRVSNTALPARVFTRIAPELLNAGKTTAGVPVRIQLMGSDAQLLAQTAAIVVQLKSPGIDLNFGCPAKLINRNGGGAILLDDPERLFEIVCAIRKNVPLTVPLTAKMRLGVKDKSRAIECAQALAQAGVTGLIVHARTKEEGYRPPAHWTWVRLIHEAVSVPVIANGEIWTYEDYLRCCIESGVEDVMLGRGALADPFLVTRIRERRAETDRIAEWEQIKFELPRYWRDVCGKVAPHHAAGRFKQWLNFLRRTYPQAQKMFEILRPLQSISDFEMALHTQGLILEAPKELGS